MTSAGMAPETPGTPCLRIPSAGDDTAHGRHRPGPACPALPSRLRLGLRRLRLPDRGSNDRGRQRTVDLGHLRPPAGRHRRWQHGRRRLRPLPPLPGGRPAPGGSGGARLSLQRQLVARPADGDRRRQPARPRLLPAPCRRPARRGDPTAGQPVPLGPAAGAAGPRRLREPAGRRTGSPTTPR